MDAYFDSAMHSTSYTLPPPLRHESWQIRACGEVTTVGEGFNLDRQVEFVHKR